MFHASLLLDDESLLVTIFAVFTVRDDGTAAGRTDNFLWVTSVPDFFPSVQIAIQISDGSSSSPGAHTSNLLSD